MLVRDPARIPHVIEMMTQARKFFPEMDLWTFTSKTLGVHNPVLDLQDPFFTEDREINKRVANFIYENGSEITECSSERAAEIETEMAALSSVWQNMPDQRFGQLVYNTTQAPEPSSNQNKVS